ncbi:MAG: zeta toxin family protein [Planctomycetaceae bacterium]
MASSAPELVVLAGPNGAGKSTLAPWLLRDEYAIDEFVNADEIAKGLSGFHPESVALQSGRLMWERLEELAENRKSFAFETTLASRTYAPWIVERKAEGYLTNLVFIWLPNSELAINRVADRVRLGGHNIPDEVIRRRYEGGLKNLFELYLPLIDCWSVIDGTVLWDHRLIAQGSGNNVIRVMQPELWSDVRDRYRTD